MKEKQKKQTKREEEKKEEYKYLEFRCGRDEVKINREEEEEVMLIHA